MVVVVSPFFLFEKGVLIGFLKDRVVLCYPKWVGGPILGDKRGGKGVWTILTVEMRLAG